jgi:DNA-binding transcriptional regulator LsrR (DeoR family)
MPRPRARAAAALFNTPAKRAVLRRVQEHVESCILYVPTAVSKAERRRQRIHRLFVRGWTTARVAKHLGMNARYVGRLYAAWASAREAEGRTVVPGKPLRSPEERAREHEAAVKRKDVRAALAQERKADAAIRAIGEGWERPPSVRILSLGRQF